jgi:hypothetical protein
MKQPDFTGLNTIGGRGARQPTAGCNRAPSSAGVRLFRISREASQAPLNSFRKANLNTANPRLSRTFYPRACIVERNQRMVVGCEK